MSSSKSFLGRGFSFPPKIDSATGRFVMVEDEEDIRQSIYIILMTRMKERAMLPDFGSNLQDYIFGLPDSEFEVRINREIQDALMRYEPRIVNVSIQMDQRDLKNGVIYFQISYLVRSTNNPNKLVFPYYLEEGIGEL